MSSKLLLLIINGSFCLHNNVSAFMLKTCKTNTVEDNFQNQNKSSFVTAVL